MRTGVSLRIIASSLLLTLVNLTFKHSFCCYTATALADFLVLVL